MDSSNDDRDLAFSPEVQALLCDLAGRATALRIEEGELAGSAQLLGIADALSVLQITGHVPVPAAPAAFVPTQHSSRRLFASGRRRRP